MFISEDKVVERESSLDNLVNKLQLRKIHNGGRPKGRKNDTTETRMQIAEHSIVHGPSETARQFNTTPSRASLLSDGIITHGNGKDNELSSKVLSKKEQIHEKALDIITKSLMGLEDSLGSVKKPRELAQIASEMAKVAERTGGRLRPEDEGKRPSVQVVIYSPGQLKSSEDMEIIDI